MALEQILTLCLSPRALPRAIYHDMSDYSVRLCFIYKMAWEFLQVRETIPLTTDRVKKVMTGICRLPESLYNFFCFLSGVQLAF